MLYFAYGSNMDWSQMKKRCPSARSIGVAMLPDHRLAFTRDSATRACGVADAVRGAHCNVWGVVYNVSDLDLAMLDKCEGYRPGRDQNSYWRRDCVVFFDGDAGRCLTTETYFAEPQPNPPLPSREYMDLIIGGARHWHLPGDYIAELARVEVAR